MGHLKEMKSALLNYAIPGPDVPSVNSSANPSMISSIFLKTNLVTNFILIVEVILLGLEPMQRYYRQRHLASLPKLMVND